MGSMNECQEHITLFLIRNKVKSQIRKDGLIKCKSESDAKLVSLKFKIEIFCSKGSKDTQIIFTHQQGSIHSFLNISRLAQSGSQTPQTQSYLKNIMVFSA